MNVVVWGQVKSENSSLPVVVHASKPRVPKLPNAFTVFGYPILRSIDFYDAFSVFVLALVLIEKIYHTLKSVWSTTKHLEVRQKYPATRGIFNFLRGVWKCCQTRSFVFDILHERFYYIDTSLLLDNTPLVKFIRNYIRDSSGVFFILSLVKILMISLISSLSLRL